MDARDLEERVRRALALLKLPRRDDVLNLAKRLESAERRLEALQCRKRA